MLLTWRKNKSTFMLFYHLFDCPKDNFGPLSTFAPWKGWRGTWKINFPFKNGFSVKETFWVILGPKMMASLNSGCSTRVHNCASFLAHYRVIRNIPDASFTFTEMVLGKMLLPPGAISHGLTSIFVDSSFFSRDCNSSLRFLRGIHNISGLYAFSWTL